MDSLNKLFDFARIAMWFVAALLLSLPAIAMKFFPDAGVDWDARDFIIMGVMFALACGTIEVAARLSTDIAYRIGAIIATGTAFLTVWVNLAVGMILSESNLENAVFLLVIAIPLVSAFLTRFSARGLAKGTLAAGIVQALIALVVAVLPLDDLFTATMIGLFCLPWLVASALFHKAAGGAQLAHA